MTAPSPQRSTSVAPAGRRWALLALMTGLAIWSQLALAHGADAVAGVLVVWGPLLLMAAVIAAVVGAWRRSPLVLIGAYPVIASVSVFGLSDTTRAILFSPVSWGFWSLSLVVYVISAAVWLASRGRSGAGGGYTVIERSSASASQLSPDPLGLSLGLYAVLGAFGLLIPSTILGIALAGADGARVAPAHLLVMTVWALALHAAWISPTINLETHAINDDRLARRWLRTPPSPRWWRVALLGGALLLAVLILWLRPAPLNV